jgi:hypothetical protein
MLPLLVIGGVAVLGFLANAAKVSADVDPPEEKVPDPEGKDKPKNGNGNGQEPGEIPGIPYVGNARVLRVFVLDTLDKPLPNGAKDIIEKNYREAVYWVNREMHFGIRYYPYVQYFSLPYTTADIRNVVLGPHPRPPEYDGQGNKIPTNSWLFFHFITDWMKENTQWDAWGGGVIDESWLFMVRGAGGFAGGTDPQPNRPGLAIVGDAVLSAWLGDAGLEVNDAYKYVFLGDVDGREEWEIGYKGPQMSEYHRRGYTTRNAQIGSFIHEGFHAMFTPYHLGDLPEFKETGAPSNIMDNWWDYPFPANKRVNRGGVYEEPVHAIVRADARESFFV